MNTWVVSTFRLLWIMLLWTSMYKFLCGDMFSILLVIYLGVEMLGQMLTLCWGTARLFPSGCTLSPAVCEGLDFSLASQYLSSLFFCYSHPGGFKVVSHCDFYLQFPNKACPQPGLQIMVPTATPFLLCLQCPQPQRIPMPLNPTSGPTVIHFLLHGVKPTSSPIQPMPTAQSLRQKGQ